MAAPGARHTRQIRLAEVGVAGQERLSSAEGRLTTTGAAALVEARYLAGAGFAAIHTSDERAAREARAVDPAVRVVVDAGAGAAEAKLPFEVADPSARAVALGAHAALVRIRSVLAGGRG